ncbi:hypothetical protein FTX61_01145 [Nitriliruptoraceae bacterium ZYF776]|nr:hypothetical protein [Profundirhabdus halotolerans]
MLSFFTTSFAIAVAPDGRLRTAPARVRRSPRRDTRPARSLQLLLGLVAVGVGVGLVIRAELGVASWDVLHVGLSGRTGWSVGTVAIVVGVGAALLAWLLGERPRWGSLVPLAVVSPSIDGTLALVPSAAGTTNAYALLVAGTLALAVGVGAYVASDHGAGPGDLVFLGVARHGVPLWAARMLVDGTAVAVGWLVGGPIGVGTVLLTVALGPMIAHAIRFFDLVPAREEAARRSELVAT